MDYSYRLQPPSLAQRKHCSIGSIPCKSDPERLSIAGLHGRRDSSPDVALSVFHVLKPLGKANGHGRGCQDPNLAGEAT